MGANDSNMHISAIYDADSSTLNVLCSLLVHTATLKDLEVAACAADLYCI